jgi:hypothetical protein
MEYSVFENNAWVQKDVAKFDNIGPWNKKLLENHQWNRFILKPEHGKATKAKAKVRLKITLKGTEYKIVKGKKKAATPVETVWIGDPLECKHWDEFFVDYNKDTQKWYLWKYKTKWESVKSTEEKVEDIEPEDIVQPILPPIVSK